MADMVRRRGAPLARWLDVPFRRLFEDFLEGEAGLPELWAEGRFVPAIDVTEDEDQVKLTAEVPGMGKEDLDVSIDNGVLTLRGEKKEEETTEEKNYHRVERRYGHFERRIRLPQYVDAEGIEAEYADGVLKLTMPKTEAAKAKQIQIR